MRVSILGDSARHTVHVERAAIFAVQLRDILQFCTACKYLNDKHQSVQCLCLV